MLVKYCANIPQILLNIVNILCKHCLDIVQIMYKYCANIVHILCKYFPRNCT